MKVETTSLCLFLKVRKICNLPRGKKKIYVFFTPFNKSIISKISEIPILGLGVKWTLNFGSGHNLTIREFEPRVGLCADSSEPGTCFGFCVSLSLCPSPTHALSLCQK